MPPQVLDPLLLKDLIAMLAERSPDYLDPARFPHYLHLLPAEGAGRASLLRAVLDRGHGSDAEADASLDAMLLQSVLQGASARP